MAGQSGHNLNISKFRRGCRLPFERADTDENYVAPSECITRQMTPEEREKYGPPNLDKLLKTRLLMDRAIRDAVKNSSSLEEAAEMLGFSIKRMKIEIKTRKIKPPWPIEEVEENAIQLDSDNAAENGRNAPIFDKKLCSGGEIPAMEKERKFEAASGLKDELLPFIEPCKHADKTPVLRLTDKGLILNLFAKRLLGDTRFVYITTNKAGNIVIVPSATEKGSYTVGNSFKGASVKMGGRQLSSTLKKRGVKTGKYVLFRNEEKGWWQTGEMVDG